MDLSLFSSDSDNEILGELSDWDTDSDTEDEEDQPASREISMKNMSLDDVAEYKHNKRASSGARKVNIMQILDDTAVSVSALRRVNYMQCLEDAEFTYKFRLTKSVVSSLLTEITPYVRVTSSRNHGVPPLHQLLLTLRYYALGTMLVSVAEFVGVSKSTAGRIVRDISSAIASLYDSYIHCHLDSVEKFHTIAGFPQVMAAIDCTHVRITSCNPILGEEFRNQNGYFSLNVQAACDADLKFMNVVARWPGSIDDETIFDNSILRSQCEAGQFGNHFFLGDAAYANESYLLTPVLNPGTPAEHKYNEAHMRTHNTIKRTLGVWKQRFPVVALTIRLSLPNIQAIIIATAVLHNICRNHNLEEVSPEVELPTADSSEDYVFQSEDVEDIETRTNLINSYFS